MQPSTCEACAIRVGALCGAINSEELVKLNAIARHKRIPAGQIILRCDEAPPYFATVMSGVVKLSRTLGDSRQQIVGLQFASDFLGRPYRNRCPYDAEAATEVQLCTYPTHQFELLMKEFPGIEHRLFERTLDELDAAHEWMLMLGRKSAREKLASLVLMIAKRSRTMGCSASSAPVQDHVVCDLSLSRTAIADFLGLTIETVSRQFSALKSDGIISLPSHRAVVVPNLARLEQAAEADMG
jgi:CRP/FNR family transcriptional regulator, anaerobic regulatory protein